MYKRKLSLAQIINRHGHWPGSFTEAVEVLPPTAHAIICQMMVAHAVIGFVNASVLRAIRRLPSPSLQEKITRSLLIPLAAGDVLHLFGTFYGVGDARWKAKDWPPVPWLNVIVGIGLFTPRCVRMTSSPCGGNRSCYRVCWFLGIGRYVATRDSRLDAKS